MLHNGLMQTLAISAHFSHFLWLSDAGESATVTTVDVAFSHCQLSRLTHDEAEPS